MKRLVNFFISKVDIKKKDKGEGKVKDGGGMNLVSSKERYEIDRETTLWLCLR